MKHVRAHSSKDHRLIAKSKIKDNAFIQRVTPDISVPEDFHWKLLSQYVEDLKGYLQEDDVCLLKTIIRTRDFFAYLQLSEAWGLQSINSRGQIPEFQMWKARYDIASLLKKLSIDDENFDKEKNALEKFLDAEKKCKFFNAFSQNIEIGHGKFNRHLLSHARSFLRKLLTDHVPIGAICRNARHGPGANLDTLDGYSDSYFKYRNIPYTCTTEAAGYARFMIKSDQRWFASLEDTIRIRYGICEKDDPLKFWGYILRLNDHNKITFVPKSATTLRSIAIEPSMNIMLQLGVDFVIRNRLRSQFNIDLSDQELNRNLSRKASIDGTYATIDLSAASDSIALKTCKLLLPDEWYNFLLKLRARQGRLKTGEILEYQKISSMGNGYTFVLESAIFSSIVYAVGKITSTSIRFGNNANVYGDDIIIPTGMSRKFIDALSAFGFRTNVEKSFTQGFVRESCGADWWLGKPIRPIFVKNIPTDIQSLFVVINTVKRHLEIRYGITNSVTVAKLKTWIPRGLHLFGPYSDEVFDSWLHSSNVAYELYTDSVFHFQRLLKRCKTLDWPAAKTDVPFRKLKASLKSIGEDNQFNTRISTMGQFSIDSKEFVVERRFVVQSIWPTYYSSPPFFN